MWYDSVINGLPNLSGDIENVAEWEAKRVKLLNLLYREEYGYPAKLSVESVHKNAEGTGLNYHWQSVSLYVKADNGSHVIELYTAYPAETGIYPAFVYIGFEPANDKLIELVTSSGMALCMLHYTGVTSDDGDMTNGLSGAVYGKTVSKPGDRPADGCGKIMLWAQAACLAADWLVRQPFINPAKLAVIGHSRLGKTALLAGAMSSCFSYVISNNSGCSGAAITRGKRGEHLDHITGVFPYWFCTNYTAYVGRENDLPFDQHFLIAMSAPRRVIVGSAAEDEWADPVAEYLGCVAASPVWQLYGGKGVELLDRKPRVGDTLYDGENGYHLRAGEHSLKLEDWERYISYIKRHT
jgi:hypothetical protein